MYMYVSVIKPIFKSKHVNNKLKIYQDICRYLFSLYNTLMPDSKKYIQYIFIFSVTLHCLFVLIRTIRLTCQ